MKQLIALVVILLAVQAGMAADKEYKEITFNELKAAPENYKYKYITYTAVFKRFATTFLPYMENSGIKSTKYFWLEIGGAQVPVIGKKTDELNKFVAGLKAGKMVKVYGKVKKFKKEPKQTLYPRYYVDLDNVELVAQTYKTPPSGTNRPPVRPRRPPFRRR